MEGKRLSLIQTILLTHLKTGFKKKGAKYPCDCYRPNTIGGEIEFIVVSPLKKVSSGKATQSPPSRVKAESKLYRPHAAAYEIS